MMALFVHYVILVEIVMIVVCKMMLLIIAKSKPDRTKLMKLCISGFIWSEVAIVSHIALYYQMSNGDKFNSALFAINYVLFVLAYIMVIVIYHVYVSQLFYESRLEPKKMLFRSHIMIFVLLVLCLYPLFTGKLMAENDGVFTPTRWWPNIYLVAGILVMIVNIGMLIVGRKSISRPVFISLIICSPLNIAALVAQSFFPSLVVSSATYVLPFFLVYVLFHSPSYDEVVGSQDAKGIFPLIDREIKAKKDFLLLYVYFPQLEKKAFSSLLDEIEYSRGKLCRRIEQIKYSIRIYNSNSYTYMAYCRVKDNAEAEHITNEMIKLLGEEVEINGISLVPGYKLIAIRNYPKLDSAKKVNSLIGYMRDKLENNDKPQVLVPTEAEMNEFEAHYRIEKELYDIRAQKNPDDERVICVAQPIYNLSDRKFHSAEMLMRLEIDGERFSPDKFISIAENNGCIHALTLIMLNKSCKLIKEMEGNKEFYGVTINCATTELEKPNFADEVLAVVDKYGIDHSKIRIEITESTSVSTDGGILYSMNRLIKNGIQFYLDDFGTGYSNVERILSYPFKTVKFDKFFLYKCMESKTAEKFLEILVKMFANAGFNTLVEGVENEGQAAYAEKMGFNSIQGFYFARPVEISELKNYFNS